MRARPITALALTTAVSAAAQMPMADETLRFEPALPARIETMPRELPRARGPGLRYSLQLAQSAVDACKSRGKPVSVRVADSVGTTVVLLSGDGAGERSQLITGIQVAAVAKHRMPGSGLAKDVRGSALMLMTGSVFVGVLAVSGAPGSDEVCATEALARHPIGTRESP